MKPRLPLLLIGLFIFSLASASCAKAAELYLIPASQQVEVGEEFLVDLKVNTEEASINAVQANLRFQNNVLELMGVTRVGSVFSFWLKEPTISNEEGTMSFVGGTSNGVQGKALQVLRMRFKALAPEDSEISLTDAVVAASDGKGTNVLSRSEGAAVSIVSAAIEEEPESEAEKPQKEEQESQPEPEEIEQPQEVEREPIPSRSLPQKPVVSVPFYPDSSKWYNSLGEVIAFWELPDDITKIATQLDNDPYGDPQEIEESLFTGKNFGILEEGVWYIHVQFKNNVGWGERAHYKISIDVTPPLPFEIEIDHQASDNPSPRITYSINDSLSGIAEYFIFIDGKEVMATSSETVFLPPQPPGEHIVKVKAVDFAGNSIEDYLSFEVLPLPTPTIDFITERVAKEKLLFASGKAMPNAFVDIKIINNEGKEVFKETVESDILGHWEISVDQPIAVGKYALLATARDYRGAVSRPSEPAAFRVSPPIILSVGPLDLGWFEIFLIVVLIVVAGASAGAWYYLVSQEKRRAYRVIAGRDVDKLSDLLAKNIKELESWIFDSQNTISPQNRANIKHFLGKAEDIIAKIKKYIGEGIKKMR